MRGDIEILNPIEYHGWDALLTSCEGYTFFHTTAWAKVLSETYNYRPAYFTLVGNGRLLALVPMMEVRSIFTGRRGVSLPFTDYCAPVIADGFHIRDMIDFIKEYGRKCRWESIESRGGHFPGIAVEASFYRHTLNLTSDVDQMFFGFKSNTRRNISKAIREGVEVKIDRSPEALNEYYRLHCTTRKRHGLPPQPRAFFNKIYEHIISKDLGRVLLASYRKRNIAGSVFFNFQDQSLYKFGASEYAYQHLRASDLAMWEGIKWHAQNGYRSLCLGRTALDNTGLRRFKARWSADEQIINYYKYDVRQDSFVTETSLVKDSYRRILSKMPIPLLKVLGSLLYQHVG